MTVRRKPFVPLRDLLQKNHDDRVQDYLEKMKGMALDDIVNSTSAAKTARPSKLPSVQMNEGNHSPSPYENLNQQSALKDHSNSNQITLGSGTLTPSLNKEKNNQQSSLF